MLPSQLLAQQRFARLGRLAERDPLEREIGAFIADAAQHDLRHADRFGAHQRVQPVCFTFQMRQRPQPSRS